MNRPVIVVVILGFVLMSGFVAYYVSRPEPKPVAAAPRAVSPAPPIVEPKPEPPKPEPPPTATRRAPSKPAATAAPAPAAPAPTAAAPATATLRIDSDVPGAQVFVDRVFIGAAPVTAPNVTPGSHRINVSAPGYEGVAETIDVAAGSRDVMIKLKEVRLDATLAVIHKHRMGSCRGQLTATPQGIRYDTTDKDDAFSVPLRNIETFEVEYLQKNLKLKLQKGKRYEFTDPDGNADRLFVFHRDVEKARDRLKKGDPPAAP